LLPEVKTVIGVIAKHNLVLATGHSSPAEGLMLLREGKQQGVRQMIVTHAIQTPVMMNVAQMKRSGVARRVR
jgi:tyrosine-protein phosphatase YwqE